MIIESSYPKYFASRISPIVNRIFWRGHFHPCWRYFLPTKIKLIEKYLINNTHSKVIFIIGNHDKNKKSRELMNYVKI